MPQPDNPDDDDRTFIQVEGMPPLSRAAIQLHSFGIVESIQDGHPGLPMSTSTPLPLRPRQRFWSWKRQVCGRDEMTATSSRLTRWSR